MANRFPLVIDTNDGNKIKELPAGDNLDLTQTSIVSVQDITATGTINAAVINVAGSPLVAQQFAQLEDTPSTYSGSESYFVKVNAAGDGLEFKSLSDLGTIEIDSVVVNTSLVPKVNNDADIGQNDKRFRTIWAEAARTDLVSFDGTTVFDATTGKIPYASLIGYPTQVSEFANDVGYVTSSALATDLSSVFAEGGNAQFDLKGSVFGDDSTMLVNALDSKVVGPIETSQATITVLTGTQVNTTAVAAVSITGFNSDLNITGGSSTQDVVIGDASQTSTKDVVLHNAKANAIGLGTGIGTGKLTSVTDLEFLSGNRIKVTNPTPFKMGPVSNTDKASIAPQEGDIIFNTDESEFQFYQNGAWVTFNTGDFIGSIFGDDSTVLVDAVNNLIVGDIDTASLKVTSEKIALGLSSGGSAALQVAQGTEAIAIGKEAGRTGQGNYGIAIGPAAGNSTQGQQAIAIGKATGGTSQGADAIAIGNLAGGINQGGDAVAIGKEAGVSDQSSYAVAVGASAGNDAQGTSATAVGSGAGANSQGQSSVAVGTLAGHISQPANAVAVGRRAQYTGGSEYAVAIGLNAGYEGQGESAVAIGHDAGQTNQAANSIVINATGVETNNTTTNSLVIKPIRSAVGTTMMMYDATTGEVTHTASPAISGDITGNVIGNVTGDLTGNVIGNVTGDVKGSIFGDDSTLLVDALEGEIYGDFYGTLKNQNWTAGYNGFLTIENGGTLDPEYNNGPIANVVGDGSDFFKREVTTNGVRIMGAGTVGGQTAVPDAWLEKVGRMFELFTDPTGAGINQTYQRNLIKNLSGDAGTYHAGFPTIQRVARGAGSDYSTNFLTDEGIVFWNLTNLFDTHVQNDMVWYLNSTGSGYGDGDEDAQEVIEHVFHTLHMHGLPAEDIKLYPYLASDWNTSDLYNAMVEAYDAGKWDPSGYQSPSNAFKTDADAFEVAAKEYLYLLNFCMFEYTDLWDGGSLAPEWTDDMRTQAGIQANNPLGYAFHNTYIAPVISKPSLTTIRSIFQDGNTPAQDDPSLAGASGYVVDTPVGAIQVVATGDLDLTAGAGYTINANRNIVAPGGVTGDLVGNTSGYHTGDMTGSVFADDSTLLVDAVNAQFVGTLVGNVIGDIEGDPVMTVSTPLQTTGEVLNITTGSNQSGFVNITSDTFRHFGDDIDFQASDTFDVGSTGTTAFTYQGATNTTVLSGLYSLTSNGVTLNGGSSAVSLEGSAINLLGPVVATGDIAASAFKGSIVGDDSTIIIDGVSGKVVAPITKIIGDVQQITGPGAISLDTLITEITTTGTDDAYSLADGVVGQIKIIAMVGDGGDAVLTPTTFANGTNVTFEDVNDNITLLFTSNGWLSTANQGNPVIA